MKPLPALPALLLALTLVVGGAAQGAVPASPSPPAAQANPADAGLATVHQVDDSSGNVSAVSNRTVHVLDIPDAELARSEIDRQTLDLGPAVGFSTNKTTWRLQTATMVERIRSAEDTSQRQRFLLGALNDIEQQTITLRSRQQETIAAYGNEEIDAKQLLVRMARISAQANALENRRARIQTLAKNTEEFSIASGRLGSLQRALDTFTGPVRQHALDVLSGRLQPTRFYVAAGEQSLVLSAIVDDTYVREAFRGSLRQRNDQSISTQEALNVTIDSYPVVWTMRNNSAVIGSGNSHLVTIPHREGHLSAFVDSGSKRVFKEFQTRPLGAMEGGEPVSEVKDGLRLQVNQTYPGAPLSVRLTDARTGNPVNANITVGLEGRDSDFVGATGFDGSLWTLTPRGRFTVTAIKGNSVVFVTLEPAQIPRINAQTSSGGNQGNQSILDPASALDARVAIGSRPAAGAPVT